jgi:maltose alpha-D-glucosyltransferase / alpha-amylase
MAEPDPNWDWYKTAVIYQVRVRSFYDTNSDGSGDLRGLLRQLDYISDLGANAIWIMPIFPSPLRDDGYDISDYKGVHHEVGTIDDLVELIREAHAKGIRVISELVLNHTSDRHEWFERARSAPDGHPDRLWYVWSDSPSRFAQADIIFQDFEHSNWAWDNRAEAFYWHRFYSHQPDLNYNHPPVQDAMLDVVDFWFSLGIDGLRLDAIPYLFEREGTSCEGLPETHQFIKRLRAHVDEMWPGRLLIAEANAWPEEVVRYFGDGDECHMAFHFPLMPRLFMAMRKEDGAPIREILDRTPAIPENCQWAVFLRNHDELTLQMVSDAERDYLWREYAEDDQAKINLGIRRRLAPLLQNDRRRIEQMNALLLSMPGTPVLYYGDEIGMGDNLSLGDRNSVRTPMQWSADLNAGFSGAQEVPLILPLVTDSEYHWQTVNVANQIRNKSSLLNWNKRLLRIRNDHPAFGRGSIRWIETQSPSALAFVREQGQDRVLAVFNLARYTRPLFLDLLEYQGLTPVELFGGTEFPAIGKDSWQLSLGPRGFCWFTFR